MRLERVSVVGFGCLRACRLDLDPHRVNLVLAANEAGKSTLLAAIETALFGFPPRATREGRETREQYRPWAGGPSRISVVLRDERHQYRVGLDVLDAAGEPIEQFTVERDGANVADEMRRAAETPGAWLLKLSPADFRRSVLVRQGELERVGRESEHLVRHLEQVITSSDDDASATEALRLLEQAVVDYRGNARLEHFADGVLAGARSWSRTEVKLQGRLEALDAEHARLHRRRDELESAIETLERITTRREGLDRARDWLDVLVPHAQWRQLRHQQARDDAARRDLAAHDGAIAEHADVATIDLDDREALSTLLERERQQRDRLEAAVAAQGNEEMRCEEANRRLEDLDAVAAAADDLERLRAELTLFDRASAEAARRERELTVARRGLGVPAGALERLTDARGHFERMTAEERQLVLGFSRRSLDLDDAQRRHVDAAREAETVVAAIDARRAHRRRLAGGGIGVAILLASTVAAGLGWGLDTAPGVALGIAATVLLMLGLPAARIAAGSRRIDADRHRREQERADQARAAARDAHADRNALRGDLQLLAGRMETAPDALLDTVSAYFEHREALAELDQASRALAEVERELQDHREQWRARLAACGRDRAADAVTLSTAQELLEQAELASRRLSELETSRSLARECAATAEAARERLLATHGEIGELLERCGTPAFRAGDDVPIAATALREAVAECERRFERAATLARLRRERPMLAERGLDDAKRDGLRDRAASIEADLDRGISPADALAELAALARTDPAGLDVEGWTLESLLPEEVLRDRRGVEQLATSLREREAAEGREVRRFLETFGRRLAEIEDERSSLAAELHRGREFAEAVGMARSTLEAVQRDGYERWSVLLSRTLADLVGTLLPGYRLESISRTLAIELVHEESDRRLDLDAVYRQLSRGAKDRFFLAVRIAIARALGSGRDTPLPLMLDDPFAHCDDERFGRGMRVLGALADEGVPVVLLSCHHSRCLETLAHDDPQRRRFQVLAMSDGADG